MATAREHMAADMAALLADTDVGVEVVIDSAPIDVIRQPVGAEEYPAEPGVLVTRERFWLLRADLGYLPEVGMELVVESERWIVEDVADWDIVMLLTLARYLS